MFGLQNVRGSCWVNAALQGLFACPTLRKRFITNDVDTQNPVEVCLEALWRTKGTSGMKDLFECIKTNYMPAGFDVGDSHELILYLCDKLPWLDEAFRFKMANQITCNKCKTQKLIEDSVIEISVTPSVVNMPILNTIQEFVKPRAIPIWSCEKCGENTGCTNQDLFGSFPKILMIHRKSTGTSMEYSSVLVLNAKKYILFAVVCHNGGHWWTYARHLPPGNAWYELNDTHVREMTSTQFPVASNMRILLYFLNEN
jgi:ubiquitin C-terminal hydrolase